MTLIVATPKNYSATNCTVNNAHNMLSDMSDNSYASIIPPSDVFLTNVSLIEFRTDKVIPDNAICTSASFGIKFRFTKGANTVISTTKYNYNVYRGTTNGPIMGSSELTTLKSGEISYLWGNLNNTAIDLINSLGLNAAVSNFIFSTSSSNGNGNTLHVYGAELRLEFEAPCNKVVVNKNGTTKTLIDLTADTVAPETLLSGYTAHDRTGTIITGTYTPEIPSNYGLVTWDGNVLTVS